ncbi:MAG: patatin-like phospholipase family protein, partial [Elusimicrobiota bacterium]
EEFKSNLQSKSDINEASIKERFTTYFSRLKLFRKMITETSIVSHDRVKSFIEEIIPDLNIEDLPVKFCCVATDITRGKRHVFRKGPLREAIMASIAVPGIIAPSQIENLILSDGGSVSVTPVEELKAAGAGFIVAIEVFPHMKERSGFDRGIEIMERCSKITAMELHRKQIAEADVIISPEVKDLVWSDFDAFNYAVEAGEKAAVGADKLIR